MPPDVLESYIVQHIQASPGPVISFSWHGGEPTLAGLDYFRTIVLLQRKHRPRNKRIFNGMQTNGILLDDEWCRFLAAEKFSVGLSLDGPAELHDRYRVTRGNHPTHAHVLRAFDNLKRHRIPCDILCAVHDQNVEHPIQTYRFFKGIGGQYLGFLPIVERDPQGGAVAGLRSVPADAYGEFLCAIFDEWVQRDIGNLTVQIFEEAARPAQELDHSLCIFRPTCGEVPAIEHNGDFYSCDHFVDAQHRLGNIREIPFLEMLESPEQKAFGEAKRNSLPRCCRECEVLDMCNGGCPKDRFIISPDGEPGLNYLCPGYKRFFTHSRPFFHQVATLARARREAAQHRKSDIGRNDPCPCGSGLKYKKCCLGKNKAAGSRDADA
jgi:uncharacterized protein